MTPSPNAWRRLRSYALLTSYGVVAIGLGLFLGWLAIQQVEWRQMTALLGDINLLALLLAFASVLAAAYLRGVRWKLLLWNEPITPRRLFLIEQAGIALDTLSFVRVLGVIVQIGILTVRDRIASATVLATLAMQRTLEFGAITLLLTGGALMLGPMRPYWPYLIASLVAAVAALTALFIIGPSLRRVWLISRLKMAHEFGDAVALLKAQPQRSALAFILSLVQSLLIGAGGWLLAFGLGLDLGLLTMIVVTLAVMFFGSYVPGLPMGFGTMEFATVTLLALWDRSATDAVSFALALRAVLYLPPVFITVAFLPNEGLFSVPAFRRLLADASGRPS
ncbi:MAG: lysylphosphatidylglycerol synthase transmembrane domain-containing protein, partial [Dehalococcoidia bacterium]